MQVRCPLSLGGKAVHSSHNHAVFRVAQDHPKATHFQGSSAAGPWPLVFLRAWKRGDGEAAQGRPPPARGALAEETVGEIVVRLKVK